jgi:hypothetical protein
MSIPWPTAENPIVHISYSLFIDFDDEGQHIYGTGDVDDAAELLKVQKLIAPLKLHPAELAAKPMGNVEITLQNGEVLLLRPVYHYPHGVYRDLFKVDHYDCFMPDALAAVLNDWRARLLQG